MDTKNGIDTSDMLNDEDYKLMKEVKEIKRHILSYLDVNILVDKIRSLIEESEVVNFRNARSAKFIDARRPIYAIIIDKDKAMDKYPVKGGFTSEENEAQYWGQVVQDEVIDPFVTFLIQSIKGDESIQEFLNGRDLFVGISKENVANTAGMLSSIFGMRMEPENKNIISLEFMP